jgi:hypothetical protein
MYDSRRSESDFISHNTTKVLKSSNSSANLIALSICLFRTLFIYFQNIIFILNLKKKIVKLQ